MLKYLKIVFLNKSIKGIRKREAIKACNDFFSKNPDADIEVIFAVLDDNIISLGKQTLFKCLHGKGMTTGNIIGKL